MPRSFLLISLLTISCNVVAARIVLTDASSGDCVMKTLVYDRVYNKRLKHDGMGGAVPFANDQCDFGARMFLGLNGEMIELPYKSGNTVGKPEKIRVLYENSENTSLFIEVKNLIYRSRDRELQCTDELYRVVATIKHHGAKRIVNGSITWGDCP